MSTTHIEQIKSRVDIVALISEYIQAKPAGSNYKALCPFHNEKTPSFMISESKQILRCFGCGKSGDIFTFLQEYEGISFAEALKILANGAGVRLQQFNPKIHTKENQMYDCARAAGAFYQHILVKHTDGQKARMYIQTRGIDELTRDTFKLGWSPAAWSALYEFLRKKGFPDSCILATGLVSRGERGYYDIFHNRLMFPIGDVYGRVVGFGGRIITEGDDKAKYINTPNTALYDKSKILYGLDKAKDAIRKEGFAIIVEGYMDVIGSHMAGVTNVVAASGTALAEEQLKLIRRFTDTVIFAFDMDEAGIKAVLRSYLLAVSLGMNTKVVQLPQGKDPYDVSKENPSLWREIVKKGDHILDFYFSVVLNKVNIRTLEGKKHLRDAILPIISSIPDMLEQTHYRQKLAHLLDIPSEELVLQQGSKVSPQRVARGGTTRVSPLASALEHLLALFSKYPYKIPGEVDLPHLSFRDQKFNALYSALQAAYNTGKKLEGEDMRVWQQKYQHILDEYKLLADKDYGDIDDRAIEMEFKRLVAVLREYVRKIKQNRLVRAMQKAEEKGEEGEIEKLSAQLDRLMQGRV
ncbi:MAG: DNA primase [Candidatus Portnoybacteria bacterium]|nr:DNA primase [Candidatus Portnoybacteria bacterium]